MVDTSFQLTDFEDVVRELVPSHHQKAVLNAFLIDSNDDADFDKIGISLTGEQANTGFIIQTSANASTDKSMWRAIKYEVYEVLCTSSKKYTSERTEGGVAIKNIVAIIATAIAGSFHVAIGVIVGAVTVALFSVMKIGKNAWCEINKPLKI